MRLIDADALKVDWYDDYEMDDGDEYSYPYVSQYQIDNAPTIDAVPVVRCKECTYSETDDMGFYYCVHGIIGGYGVAFDADTFCSYGERKDNEIDRR